MSGGGTHVIKYTIPTPIWIPPTHIVAPVRMVLDRISLAFQDTESGADASNHSQVQLAVDPLGSHTVIATMDTRSNPVRADDILTQDLYHVLEPGQLIWAYWTKVGAGTTNYANKTAVINLDVLLERLS